MLLLYEQVERERCREAAHARKGKTVFSMITVDTRQGKRIAIISQSELCDPLDTGEYVRAYCHIHGSDHQRSLSINRATGWGHCFNAACEAIVLVAEWNPRIAQRLTHPHGGGASAFFPSSYASQEKRAPLFYQPVLLRPTRPAPKWQQDELAALLSLEKQMRAALLHSRRARAYLEERGIPLEIALATGVGYLPEEMLRLPEAKGKWEVLHRWAERIVFPLVSLAGSGYVGRTLWGWHPGMDENAHKSLLDRPRRPRRWIKTNPAGWFCSDLDQLARKLILVEGAFDRLTLIAAGFQATEVVALVGTAAPADWFPPHVDTVILALDADEGGREASNKLADRLTREGFDVRVHLPQQEKWGKDWNERWRRMGDQAIQAISDVYVEARSA